MRRQLDEFLAYYRDELDMTGERLAEEAMPELTEELFGMFEATGNRIGYEKVYFRRRKMLSVFGVLAILDKRQEDIEKLEEILQSICNERCWALPAHVNREQNGWEITIDLFAAETAFYLAELVGRLKTYISDETKELVRKEVFRRVLTPFLQSESPYAWWENCNMNWCAVCNGAIGGAAIWMIEDSKILNPLLQRICNGLEHYIDGFGEDGACLEGLGYYTYGLSFYVAFAALLKEYTQGEQNLFANEKLRKIALFQQKCYLPGGKTVSFADSSSTDEFRMGLTCYLKMHYPEVELPELAVAADLESDNCYRYLMISRDLLFTEEYRKHLLDIPDAQEAQEYSKTSQIVLEQAQWSIAISRNQCVLAVKGGNNGEPHNHNDVGSFFYQADGEQILADLGVGEYTREYFGEKRYEQLCCRSMGHNLPLIDCMEQLAGPQYKASSFSVDGKAETCVEIGSAYALAEDEHIFRKLNLNPENDSMQVRDTFSIRQNRRITENLVTQHRPELMENGFVIHTQKHSYQILCGQGKEFRIVYQSFHNHQGIEEDVWLMQWDVTGNVADIRIEQI